MARFYIEKLIVSGGEHEPSVIDFKEGLNLIIGPSNTGKTIVVACIDYLFGFEEKVNKPPFKLDKSFGYTTVTLITRTANGTVVFGRKLGDTKITVSGTDTSIKHGEYSINHKTKNNISDIWLRMMGINEEHDILATISGKVNQLTLRAMLHMFLIKQPDIARETSVLLQPNNYTDTPSRSILLFLMSGRDAKKSDTAEDKKIRNAKRTAVISYIKDNVSKLVQRESALLKQRDEGLLDIKEAINSVRNEIKTLQAQINTSVAKSRQLMEDIYAKNGKLAECETISNRFSALRSQYHSDVERLTFIIEGQQNLEAIPVNSTCPFCESEITKDTDASHVDAARAELSHIRTHLMELQKAEKNISTEHVAIKEVIVKLEAEKDAVDRFVSGTLTPRITDLNNKLNDYRRAVELSKELQLVQEEERALSIEISDQEAVIDAPDKKHNIYEYFDDEQIWAFEEKLIAILEACQYEGFNSARLNLRGTFDLEVGGKAKSTVSGGGYCAFLNTIVALALVQYLEVGGAYSPGFLIVDSPLSQLSEPQIKEQAKTKKAGFFNYLLSDENNKGSGKSEDSPFSEQIIIVEHPERLPFDMSEHKNAHITRFTRIKGDGRYGFLNGVYNEQ